MAGRRLREQNKQHTLAQIKQVAKHLFEQKGYEETTTREIAEAAGIGTGTLFLYVRDKAELLILVYTDALAEIITSTFATLTADMPLLDALISVFSLFFDFYEHYPANARFFLKELIFYATEHKDRPPMHSLSEDFVERLTGLVREKQRQGVIRQDVDPHLVASSFYALYLASVMAWLGMFVPAKADVLAQLRAVLALQIEGIHP